VAELLAQMAAAVLTALLGDRAVVVDITALGAQEIRQVFRHHKATMEETHRVLFRIQQAAVAEQVRLEQVILVIMLVLAVQVQHLLFPARQ
jgi:hypothetical protein